MSNKISNLFSPLGGITGALIEAGPTLNSIYVTVIFAIIGATVGYFVKLFWDYIFKKKS
jgi:hypothetical protein